MRIIINVDFTREKELDPEVIANHIRDSVGHWGGSYDPECSLFPDYINVKNVTVKNQRFVFEKEE